MEYPPPKAKKTQRRMVVIDGILKSVRNPNIYSVVDYRNWDESKIRTYMHRYLIEGMESVFRALYPNQLLRTIKRKADKAVLWESDVGVTISNIQFFGVQHRPDFVVKAEEIKVAVEVKKGDSGSSIRDGIGQSLVYSSHYGFVVYLCIDISIDKKIRDAIHLPVESEMIKTMWDRFNIKLEVV